MAGACGVSWVAATVIFGRPVEVLLGMIAPLAVASASLVLAERAYRRHRGQLTQVMLKAFIGKMVFFGAYVAAVPTVLSLQIVPFIVSFTTYFIALHLAEAVYLRRLFAGPDAARSR